MSDDISFDVKVAIQRAVLFHPLFEGTAADALEIAIAAIKAGDEIRNCPECASSPAQEPVTTDPIALDHTAAAKAAEAIFDYTDNNLTMFDATDCPSEKAQQLYEAAKILRDMFRGDWLAIPAPPQPGREWQSIDTAPKDGTWVLSTTLGNNPYTHQPFVPDIVQWAGSRWNNGLSDHGYQPTHWQPLPAPPDGDQK